MRGNNREGSGGIERALGEGVVRVMGVGEGSGNQNLLKLQSSNGSCRQQFQFVWIEMTYRQPTNIPTQPGQPGLSASRGPQPGAPTGIPASRIATSGLSRDVNIDFEGEHYDSLGDYGAVLRWSVLPQGQNVVISGSSDTNNLARFKNILLALRDEFAGPIEGPGHIVITGEKRDDFNKRLILLENEIQGLLKRKIDFTVRDQQGGTRVMDYTNLLNEKENQIVELEKKINNLEERLRRAAARETELENHIVALTSDVRRKDGIVGMKNDQIMAEVASSNVYKDAWTKLKLKIDQNRAQLGPLANTLFDGIQIPDGLDIRADALIKDSGAVRSSAYQAQSQPQKYKTNAVALFRELQRLNNSPQGFSDTDFQKVIQGFLLGLNGSRLKDLATLALDRQKTQEKYQKLRTQFGVAAGMYKIAIDKLRQSNPSLRIDVDRGLFDLLQSENVNVERVEGGLVQVERFTEKTVEVPVQDARTKHLMHLLASQMRKLSLKYPKILAEMDVRLTEFFQQELIDIIEVDELDRVVEIVKYVPQVVKVENVYAYSSEKSKKVEFHLRVLIKALLEQLEKLKRKTGAVLEIDQGIIGMINQEIMGVVDVDDVLKVFRVVPKIVEVQKIVEKVVERKVQVPQVVSVEKVVEKIVEVEKVKEVEKIVNVPIEVPQIVNNIVEKIVPIEQITERIVEVPTIMEKIVEVKREVPKIVEVERIVEKEVEVDKVITVEKQVNHFVPEIKEVQIVVEKLVPVEKIVQKIIQVPTIVQKIIEKIVQVPQIIQVQKIVEKIVQRVDYRIQKQMIPYVNIQHKIVQKIIQKPIPIIQKQQKIVQVPQIIQKIVQVTNTVQQIKQVEIIKQRIVIQDRIKEVERIVEKVVPLIKEVEKIVEKRVEVPVVVERVVTVPEIVTKTVVQKVENTIVKEVFIRDPLIVKQPFIMEVEKFVNHYIDVPRVVKHIEEKIVEVPRHIEKIKEVRVLVEKIIDKMVEVPKVVQVQKIVEKIVVVPRVIQKIIEVPQIVEVPVQKIITQVEIREVEKIIQVPVIQEKVVEVEVPKNIYVEVEKVVDRIVDKTVEVPRYEEKVVTNEVIQDRVVEVVREVPREIEVERLVPQYIEKEKIVEIEKPIVVPVEIPVPVDRIVEKLVPVYQTVQKLVQVPQIVQKIVQVRVDDVKVHQTVQVTRDVVVDTKVVQVPRDRIIVQQKVLEVPTIREKIVQVNSIAQQIVTAQQVVEKVVERTVQVPKVYEVEKLVEKLVEVPKIVEIETLVPQLIRVNNYVQNIVEKIVEVPIIMEKILEVPREREKIVAVSNEVPKIVEVEKIVEKAVYMEKLKEVVRNINHIEQVLQIVDRYEQTPVTVHTSEQKLIQVPHILEKIVEKIVVMPQIVEVLKYVHEVVESEELGVAVGVDVMTHEQRYKILTKDLKASLELILVELRKLKASNPGLRIQIEIIERFLAELEKFILFPKIVQVPVEKIVEKTIEVDKIVRVPTQDQRSLKMQLTLSLLVQKLIVQLKRLKQQNPNLQLRLDDDVRFIFFGDFDNRGTTVVSENLNSQLKTFSDAIYRKFQTLGDWTTDHQLMLNSFLQERFVMANIVKNANLEIEKSKQIGEKRLEGLRRYKNEKIAYENYIKQITESLPKLLVVTRGLNETKDISIMLEGVLRDFDKFIVTTSTSEPLKLLEDINVTDKRISSLLREKDAEILKLREKLISIEKARLSSTSADLNERTIIQLKTENTQLKNQISLMRSKMGDANVYASYKTQVDALNERILQLQQEKSNLTLELRNIKNQYDVRLNLSNSEVDQLKIRLGQSGVVEGGRFVHGGTEGTPLRSRVEGGAEKGPGVSTSTRFEAGSSMQSPEYRSPMNKLTSPTEMKMVESVYRAGEKGGDARTTYGSSASGVYNSAVGPTGGQQLGSQLTSSGTRNEPTSTVTYGTTQGGATTTTGQTRPSGTFGTTAGSTSAYRPGEAGYGTTSGGAASQSTYGAGYGTTSSSGTAGYSSTSGAGQVTGSGTYGTSSGTYGTSSGTYGTSSGSYGTAGGATGGATGTSGISTSYQTGTGYQTGSGYQTGAGYQTYGSGVSGATGTGATRYVSGATGTTGTTGATGTSGTGASGATGTSGTSGTSGTGGSSYSSSYRYTRE